jgi:hypothetical protein
MIRYLPLVLSLVLTIYALIDCFQVDEREVRSAPKWAWVLLILLVPVVGPIVYLVVGRPYAQRRSTPPPAAPGRTPAAPRRTPLAPDEDPEFLASLRKLNTSHERVLDEWENDLRRREQELKDKDGTTPTDGEPEAR